MNVLSPEEAALTLLKAAIDGPTGMRPKQTLKSFTLRQRAMEHGLHIDDFIPAVEYALQLCYLEDANRGFFRLTEPGYAFASNETSAAPSHAHTKNPSTPTAAATSEGQSGGITANEVHIHAPVTFAGTAPVATPLTTEPRKVPWWKRSWAIFIAILTGIAVILSGFIPLFDWLHIESPWHTKAPSIHSTPPPAPPVELKEPEPSPVVEPTHSGSTAESTSASTTKPIPRTLQKRSPAKSSGPEPSPSAGNNVGAVYNNSGIIAPGGTVSITQQVQGYIPPPPRVMTSEQLATLVDKLQLAPPGSVARLNFAASKDSREVHDFFTQIETAFKRADHWTENTQEIGKSMGTADGGTLTAEGIGCTVVGTHGALAVDALAAAGFPCTRKAADWGVASPPPGDIVISIGSRIVPLE